MSVVAALALCLATPIAALLIAPWMFRTFGERHDTVGLMLTLLFSVSGPLAAIMLVR